jgi:hypothetical protein
MKPITHSDLVTVTGGHGECRRAAHGWEPTPGNRTLGRRLFPSFAGCSAAVKQWQNSPMNVDNNRAD